MSLNTFTGAIIITFALLAHGIGVISMLQYKVVNAGVLFFIVLGVSLDIVAAAFMIAGTQGTPFTMHGVLGFSATTAMVVNLLLVWRIFLIRGMYAEIKKPLRKYTQYAFGWWLVSYITGSLMVLF